MKTIYYTIIIVLVYLIIVYGASIVMYIINNIVSNTENFTLILEKFGATSPGTMVQLSTSHVPNDEDVDFYTNVYPKMVRRDITDMTGSDPGEILFSPYRV